MTDKKKSRQDRSGLARITGAGKKKARDLPPVPTKRIWPDGHSTVRQPKKKDSEK